MKFMPELYIQNFPKAHEATPEYTLREPSIELSVQTRENEDYPSYNSVPIKQFHLSSHEARND